MTRILGTVVLFFVGCTPKTPEAAAPAETPAPAPESPAPKVIPAGSVVYQPPQPSQTERPNILLLVGDDMGLGDIGPFGSEISTPALEMLASEGLRFSNFHASPVCSVTRGQLMTGNNSIEVGMGSFDYAVYPEAKGKPGYEGYLTHTAAAMPELLQDAGYRTYHVGKWHLGGISGGEGPMDWGFTRSYGILAGGSNHWNDGDMLPDAHSQVAKDAAAANKVPPITKTIFYENGSAVERPAGIYSDDLYVSKMLGFMEEGRSSGDPFFAYVAFTTAHLPIQAPSARVQDYVAMYRSLGWDGLKKQRFQQLKDAGVFPEDAKMSDPNPITRAWNDLPEDQKDLQATIFATYAAMIESQDHHVGRIIDYLRETGELDNTLIIYMTDNGPEGTDAFGPLGNPVLVEWMKANYSLDPADVGHGNSNWQIGMEWANGVNGPMSWWKWFVTEGGVRVPLIVRPPASKFPAFEGAGDLRDTFVGVKDLPMTILEIAGVEHPGTEYKGKTVFKPSGLSMVPYLNGQQDEVHPANDWVAFELFGNAFVIRDSLKAVKIRTGMWGDGEWHLYDTRNDPGETTPLESEQPDVLAEFVEIYGKYAEEHSILPVREDWNPMKELGH